jgi:hypothetical protein
MWFTFKLIPIFQRQVTAYPLKDKKNVMDPENHGIDTTKVMKLLSCISKAKDTIQKLGPGCNLNSQKQISGYN